VRRTVYLLLLVPTLLFADEVHLQGGAVFSGRIVEQTETMVTVDIGDGEVGVPMSRVESIVKKRSPLDDYDARAAGLAADDVDGWRNLGRWASQQGLSAQSRQAYQKVLDIAPDDPEARGALGFVLFNGSWMTEDESFRARGYVKVHGEWMTQTEAQIAESAAASEQARQDAEQRANQAEADKILAESRAEKAEERARKAEETDVWNQPPVYWGGWGVGVSGWPSTADVRWKSGYQPARSQPINPKPR
jgi:tetratricopeptide (TPR) repeat protein